MRYKRSSMSEESNIDLTPMLDVVFIMLIFFIVTTSFTKESGIQVQHPTAATAQKKQRVNIFIAISKSGEIWIHNKSVDIRSVRANVERLHAESPKGGVVIQADKNSKNGLLVQVMDQVRLAGIHNISLAAKVANTKE